MADASGATTILVVDDDRAVRESLRKILGRRWQVVPAADGSEALRLLQQGEVEPDLVLLDVRMPGMDGYEVCRAIQDEPSLPPVPVVFVTVLDSEQDRQRAFDVGAAGYVTKPFEAEELVEAVEEHLGTSARWRELDEKGSPDEVSEEPRGTDGTLWDRLRPDALETFKRKLVDHRDPSEENRGRIVAVGPEELYGIAEPLSMSVEQVARHLADFLDLPYVERILADDVRLGALPRAFCRSHLAIPMDDGSVAVANPFDHELLDALRRSVWRHDEPSLAIASPDRIEEVFERGGSTASARDDDARILRLERSGDADRSSAQERANEILRSAIVEGASDIHVEPKEGHTRVRYRIDGEMHAVRTLSQQDAARVVSRLKAMADMDIAERRKPQDGSLRARLGDRDFKLRLATSSTADGESLVVRLLEPDADPVPLEELGMTEEQARDLRETMSRSQGTVLVVGPTGSGKSTTVFTLLSSVDASSRSLLSVEDPVEYTIPQAKQQEVKEKAGLTFESLLKSAMRQDPDILFLGEVRDSFSANAVLDFASSGHLTVSTLHSANATTAVFRLERLGVSRGAMADALSVVVAQKLLRTLCPECKEVGPPDEEELDALRPFTDDLPDRVARPRGCPSCRDTGYHGREGVYELLRFDADVSGMVREGAGVAEIRAFCAERGDLLISGHAIEKIRDLRVPVADVREQILLEARERLGERDRDAADEPDEPDEAAGSGGVEASEATTASTGADEPKAEATGTGTILVVEDDPDTRFVIEATLETGGYTPITAEDGVEALMKLGGGEIRAVISDLEMPNMDGAQLLEMMHEKGVELPVIFVTGKKEDGLEARLLQLGARDFITKPVKKDVLLLRLERALQG